MKAYYTPAGGAATQLAGADADYVDAAHSFSGGREGAVQVTAIVRGAKPKVHDRKNHTRTLRFSVRTRYATPEAAYAANVALMAVLDSIGTLVVKDYSNNTIHTVNNAAVRMEWRIFGCMAEREFDVSGTV
jgi:hypothetical protein